MQLRQRQIVRQRGHDARWGRGRLAATVNLVPEAGNGSAAQPEAFGGCFGALLRSLLVCFVQLLADVLVDIPKIVQPKQQIENRVAVREKQTQNPKI